MEDKLHIFKEKLKTAIQDSDIEMFDKVIEQRNAFLETIEDEKERKNALSFFIESDKEIYQMVNQKKEDVQQILLHQNNQIKAVHKYDQY